MLAIEPKWAHQTHTSPTRWYGRVKLLPNRVLGQWMCLDRESGKLLWRRNYWRPNTVDGIDGGVVVASESRQDGPMLPGNYGCYGISVETGFLRWTSHFDGLWGLATKIMDYVPEFTNGWRDTAGYVEAGKVFTCCGRILDVRTGVRVGSIDPAEVDKEIIRRREPHDFMALGEGWTLRPDTPGRYPTEYHVERPDGSVSWRPELRSPGRYLRAWEGLDCFLYVIASDKPYYCPDASDPKDQHPGPYLWRQMTYDVRNGTLLQDFPLGTKRWWHCRIEDIDDRGLLLTMSNGGFWRSEYEILYFKRAA